MEFPQTSVFHLLLPCNIFVLSSLAPCSFLYKKASPLEFLATIIGYSVAMEDEKLRKGPWYEEEDERLTAIVAVMGERRWDSVATVSGLRRSGKSCRMRWMNYLRPNLKHGRLSAEEERIILQLHKQWGNKWSKIARRLPGRTDNEIKNYWRSHLRKNAQVREQGNYDQSITNNAKQDVLVPKFDNGDCTSVKENILRTTDDHSDVFELSNYGIASSPYEVRISDWMSSWSDEQSEVNRHHGECQSLDSGFCCYSVWNSKDHSDNGLWDSSDFLWDTD